jgi:hypothetical protein
VSPLDRAIALAEVDAVAEGVEQHLDLDVARPLEEALEDQAAIAECCGRLATAGRDCIAQPSCVPHDPHALPATAGRRLDEDRQPDPLRGRGKCLVRLVDVVVAGEDRNAETHGEAACGGLVAHLAD